MCKFRAATSHNGTCCKGEPICSRSMGLRGKNDVSLISVERLVAHQVIVGSWTQTDVLLLLDKDCGQHMVQNWRKALGQEFTLSPKHTRKDSAINSEFCVTDGVGRRRFLVAVLD